MQRKNKWLKRGVWITLAVIAAAGLGMSLINAKKPQFDTETVRTRDIETFYTFSGNIQPDEAETVYALSAGKVSKIYFIEGDTAEKEENVMRTQNGQVYEAPIAGTLTDLYVEANDLIKAGDPLFRTASYDRPVVRISIDEYDIGAIKAGEKVTVYIQALDKTVDGVIEKVDREATITGNVAYYGAKVSIAQENIPMGMTCEVSVPKQSAYGVPAITLKSVKFDENNKPFVYMYDRRNEVIAEYVTLGVSNGTTVQVLNGLRDGDVVLIPKDNSPMFMSFQDMRGR